MKKRQLKFRPKVTRERIFLAASVLLCLIGCALILGIGAGIQWCIEH